MKKFVFAAIIGAALFFPSCQKCAKCIVMDEDGEQFYDYPEACGKEAIEESEKLCKSDYEHAGYPCVCEETR